MSASRLPSVLLPKFLFANAGRQERLSNTHTICRKDASCVARKWAVILQRIKENHGDILVTHLACQSWDALRQVGVLLVVLSIWLDLILNRARRIVVVPGLPSLVHVGANERMRKMAY